MSKLIFFIVIFYSSYLHAQTLKDIKVFIIDKHGISFSIDSVSWWYSKDRNNKHKLSCAKKTCANWSFKANISKPITINANTSISSKSDKACWLLYHTEAVIDKPVEIIEIKMQYTGKACK